MNLQLASINPVNGIAVIAEVRGECLPPASGGTPQTPKKSFKLEILLWQNHGYTRPDLVQGTALVPGKLALVPRHDSRVFSFAPGAPRSGQFSSFGNTLECLVPCGISRHVRVPTDVTFHTVSHRNSLTKISKRCILNDPAL